VLRFSFCQTSSPVDTSCSFCNIKLPSDLPYYVIETDPLNEKEGWRVENEYETSCYPCLDEMKKAMIKFQIPIDWDLEVAPNTRLAVGFKLKLKD
jgi:hypothetical protein